ncbi:MAG: hypothetical protein B5M52_07390 [Helicobacteraceae bacterium 4484_230]|nr:MAG: hypothetical protein B5M52_07390 [Helicobacteraceae bacterium 4484_230]
MRYTVILFLFLTTLYGSWQNAFLPPEEAFKASAELKNGSRIEVDIKLGKDIYLYEESLKLIDPVDNDGIVFKKISTSESVDHHDEKVYLEDFHATVELAKEKALSGHKEIELQLSFQGCSEKGLCYEPMTEKYTFSIDVSRLPMASGGAMAADAGQDLNEEQPPVAEKGMVSETDEITRIIKEGSIAIILLSFLGFGLLLSLTPCIFPMIPILSSVIVAQGKGITTRKAFMLSLTYVLAMSVAYTLAGVLAGLFGANLQAAFQTPWVIILFSIIFVVLSLSMFDLYELQIPSFIQSKLNKAGEARSGYIGVAIMGFLSALIVGPCIAAPLAGALVYIGQTGDALLGGMALFSLSIGMGVPLLLIGTSAGRFMPKPGPWMDMVKFIFGIMLLGVAIWFLSRIVSPSQAMILWSFLLIYTAVSLGAFEPLRKECDRCGQSVKKALAILIFIYGTSLFIGGLAGSENLFRPFEKFTSGYTVASGAAVQAEKKISFRKIHSISELDKIIEISKGKKILLDFYADWCTSCQEYEHITFADPAVKAKMAEFVLVQADVTVNTEEEKALTKKFGLFGPPAIIFFDENGRKIEGADIIGYQPPEPFLQLLERL